VQQIACVRLLIEAGANASIPNGEGFQPQQLVTDKDDELKTLFNI
jgi:hypothetical protein